MNYYKTYIPQGGTVCYLTLSCYGFNESGALGCGIGKLALQSPSAYCTAITPILHYWLGGHGLPS